MAVTYEPIASQTLGADASSVTFSSIPGGYTDLRLVATGRTDRTADDFEALAIRFNSDSASNYSSTRLQGSGGTTYSDRTSSQTYLYCARFNPSASSNTSPSVTVLDFMSYANTSAHKTVLSASSATAENRSVDRTVALWRSTSAITTIAITSAQGSNFKSGSVFSLYGIKAA